MGAIAWWGDRQLNLIMFSLCAGALLQYAVSVLYPMWRTRKRAQAGKLSSYHLAIDSDWLHIRTDDCDGQMSWRTVEYVRETATTIYLMCSIMSGMIIPKRSFASPEEAAQFARLCEQFRQAAGNVAKA